MKMATCVYPITSMPDARGRKRVICSIRFPQHQTIAVSNAVGISHSVYIFWDSTNKEEFYHLFSSPTRIGISNVPLENPFPHNSHAQKHGITTFPCCVTPGCDFTFTAPTAKVRSTYTLDLLSCFYAPGSLKSQ